MLIENNSNLVVISDSISDFERARPVGEGLFKSIGKSYIALIDSFLGFVWTCRRSAPENLAGQKPS